MAGRIPQTFIDDLLNRVDIVDIIDADLPLKKTGRDYQALCPFHGEKTPSFTVSQEKQFYHCFGCGAHGSALGFLMNHRGLSFVEAVEEAARSVGLEVPREDGGENAAPKIDYSPLYDVLNRAQAFFAAQLKSHPDRDRPVEYLKARGLSGVIAKRFGMGYAPDAWDSMLGTFGDDDKTRQHLLEAGLIVENENKRRYDRFRDRVMFPIHDRRGRVVGFGGRVIDKGEPKYLNSPETPVFQKRRELYGLYQLRKANQRVERIIVVEGYMDVVALAQFGVNNAVATLGTATTGEQLETLFKTAPEVVFCYDGDKAGQRAAWRALETTLPLIRDTRQAGFIFIPQGHDPDSFVREKGPEYFNRADSVTPLSEFLLSSLKTQTNMQSLEGRSRFVELARPLVKRIPPGPFQQLLVMRITELAEMPAPTWWQEAAPNARPVAPARRRPASRRSPSMVDQALKRLLFDPALAAGVTATATIAKLPDDHALLLAEILEFAASRPELTTGALVERYRGSEHEAVIAAQIEQPLVLDREAEAIQFHQAIETLVRKATAPSALEQARAELERRNRATD